MKIYYQDEYGEDIYKSEKDVPSALIPQPGDIVTIDDEDWRAVSRTFHPKHSAVVVSVTQNQVKANTPDDFGDRLTEVKRAIVETNKRQDKQDKLTKSLREQAMSIRAHIRRNQPKPKETQ